MSVRLFQCHQTLHPALCSPGLSEIQNAGHRAHPRDEIRFESRDLFFKVMILVWVVWRGACHGTVLKVREQLCKLVLPFQLYVGSSDQTQVATLYSPSCITSPKIFLSWHV